MSTPVTAAPPDPDRQLSEAAIAAQAWLRTQGYASTFTAAGLDGQTKWVIRRREDGTVLDGGTEPSREDAWRAVTQYAADLQAADDLALGIVLAAVAEYGPTRRALAQAVLAVALSDAFADEDDRQRALRTVRTTDPASIPPRGCGTHHAGECTSEPPYTG